MPVPTYDLIGNGMELVRVARERLGGTGGYAGSYSITSPISLKDLSSLSGGNAGGSGNNYPSVNLLNPVSTNFNLNRRPDGANPLKMSEFFGYNQTLTRSYVRFAFSSSSSSTACSFTMSATIYYHNGSGVYPVGGDRMYTTYGGFTAAAAGYYQLFNPTSGVSNGTWVEVLGGGGGLAGTVGNSGNC
tara:strand:+ start:693 stop:1256 length:564 start_codon:yes stop_codon:yes gene_type:complete